MSDAGQGSTPVAPTPPELLRLARMLWIASTLLAIVRMLVQAADRPMLVSMLREQSPDLPQDQVDAAVNGSLVLVLLASVAVAALYVWLANRMVRGRQWARVIMSVLCFLNALGVLITLVGVATWGVAGTAALTQTRLAVSDLVFGVVTMLLDLAVLVLLFHPRSGRFFRELSASKRVLPSRFLT